SLKHLDTDGFTFRARRQGVAQRPAEEGRRDFEHVAHGRLDAIRTAQRAGPVEIDMHVSRPAKSDIFEMMMLQIGDGVAHIRLAREEFLPPYRLPVPQDLRSARDMRRKFPDQQFRSVGTLPELRMRQIKIVAPL